MGILWGSILLSHSIAVGLGIGGPRINPGFGLRYSFSPSPSVSGSVGSWWFLLSGFTWWGSCSLWDGGVFGMFSNGFTVFPSRWTGLSRELGWVSFSWGDVPSGLCNTLLVGTSLSRLTSFGSFVVDAESTLSVLSIGSRINSLSSFMTSMWGFAAPSVFFFLCSVPGQSGSGGITLPLSDTLSAIYIIPSMCIAVVC